MKMKDILLLVSAGISSADKLEQSENSTRVHLYEHDVVNCCCNFYRQHNCSCNFRAHINSVIFYSIIIKIFFEINVCYIGSMCVILKIE